MGSGTQAAPWKYATDNTNVATTANGGNVTVTSPGAVTTITLTYWSDTSGSTTSNQAIAIGDFTFNALGC